MFTLELMDEVIAKEIAAWKYPPPYEIYNCADEEIEGFLDPENHYYAVKDANDNLIGFRCFGPDARVPGGNYEAAALDMGGGLRPDLTGQGKGIEVLQTAIDFAIHTFDPPAFRTTVAAFNQRALKVCQRLGYMADHRFQHTKTAMEFVVLLRDRA